MIAVGAAFVVRARRAHVHRRSRASRSAKSQARRGRRRRSRTSASELAALQPILDRENQITALAVEPADAARDRRRVADDDRSHHGEPPAGHHAHVVRGPGRRRPCRSRPRRRPPRRRPTSSSGGRARTRRRPTTAPPPPPAPTITGTITFQGKAKDYPTLAAWIDAMGKVPQIVERLRHQRAGGRRAADGGRAAASRSPRPRCSTPAAQSNRLDQYVKAAK